MSVRLLSVVLILSLGLAALVKAADEQAAAARASLARIENLRKERPADGLLVFYEAMVRVSVGEKAAALELLRSLKGRKLGLVPVSDNGFEAVWDDPEFQKIRGELADEDPKTANAPVAFRLPDPKLIPEGIAYAPASGQFFVGSTAQHKIIETDGKGEVRDFSKPSDKLDAVLGLAIDEQRGHLYAVSTNGFEAAAQTQRRNAVVRYDLKTKDLSGRFDAPEAMQLNDLTIAPDGTLYVTDSMGGSLFRKKPDETSLSRLGKEGALRGANGIAFGTQDRLYVAVSTGIVRIDLNSGEPTLLPQPDTVVTGGLDGLYWYKGDLIGIQNGPNPGRVVRIFPGDGGNRVARMNVLQSCHHPDFDEPTTGAIANGKIYVIGNSYVGHYQPDGTIRDGEKLQGTAIIAVPLGRLAPGKE